MHVQSADFSADYQEALKAPSQWLRTQSVQSLIAELEKETVQICIVSAEDRNRLLQGSWSHPDHGVQQSVTTLITGKGLAKLQKILSSRS
ncbi:KilA-N domain-containing protein [Salmonella enterica]|nr:KilA-N domain-containing protein [Salmonella enterica]